MATGYDPVNQKGVLDGSASFGTFRRSLPAAPLNLKQAAYFFKMGFNSYDADTGPASDLITWPNGLYWGLLYGDDFPTGTLNSPYVNFLGIRSDASSTGRTGLNTLSSDPVQQDYASGGSATSNDTLFHFGRGTSSAAATVITSRSGGPLANEDMIGTLPRDPSVPGTLVINLIASEIDPSMQAEVWLCPQEVDFASVDFTTLNLANITSVFPNSNGWSDTFEIQPPEIVVATNLRDANGNFTPPDNMVVRMDMPGLNFEIYDTAFAYRN